MRGKEKSILIVCEGKSEAALFERIIELYPVLIRYNIYLYNTNIHILANHIVKNYLNMGFSVEEIDTIQVLKEIRDSSILKNKYTDILLIFDFDPHDPRFDELNLTKMLEMFCLSSDQGQLYINYPMVESILDFNRLPDHEYSKKEVDKKELLFKQYKNRVIKNSTIKGFDSLDLSSLPILLMQTQDKLFYLVSDTTDPYKKLLDNQISRLKNTNEISIINTSVLFLNDYNSEIFKQFLKGEI